MNAPAHRSAIAVMIDVASIAALWAAGGTFASIATALKLPLSGSQVREVVLASHDLVKCLDAHHETRSFLLADKAVEWACAPAATGTTAGYRIGIDTMLKLAARFNPLAWGDAGSAGPGKQDARRAAVTADVTLSPAEAYARLAKYM